jgi:sugar phosphate isomerase/epimerase
VYDAGEEQVMKFGTRTQVLKQPTERVFQEAARLGFDGLEFDLARDYQSDILWTAEGRQRLLDQAAETGVEVASVCLGALWSQTFAADDPEARERAKEIVTAAARFTPQLGATVILVPIVGVEAQTPAVGVDRWIEGLRACAPVAEETGAVLALENVGRSPARSAPEILNIIAAVGSPAVKVYYDVGNGTSFGFDATEELRLLGDQVAQVHIKGARSAQLWENTLDMDAVAQTLKAIGYDGYLVFETQATEQPLEGAGRNLELLKGYIAAAYGPQAAVSGR